MILELINRIPRKDSAVGFDVKITTSNPKRHHLSSFCSLLALVIQKMINTCLQYLLLQQFKLTTNHEAHLNSSFWWYLQGIVIILNMFPVHFTVIFIFFSRKGKQKIRKFSRTKRTQISNKKAQSPLRARGRWFMVWRDIPVCETALTKAIFAVKVGACQ